MKKLKIIVLIIVVGSAILQLFPSKLPETSKNNPNDLLANNTISDSLSTLLKNGCYDCHSNETNYPWYSYIKPAAWLVIRDTKEGRAHLNFSEWESLSIKKKLKLLNETAEEIEAKKMPFPPYLLTHKNARLTKEERALLIKWTEEFGESLLQ